MNVLATQNKEIQREQGTFATNDPLVGELTMWFSELQSAY